MNVQITKTDISRINAFVISCWLGVMNMAFNLNLSMQIVILPVITYYALSLIELIEVFVREAKARPRTAPHEAHGEKVHWNPKTKSMYEDLDDI